MVRCEVRCRPLNQIARWVADHRLPISLDTLADRIPSRVPLFEPLYQAILSHQNQAPVRQGDETSWRVQATGERGRSSRGWRWTALSLDSVSCRIDWVRYAEVASKLFGDPSCATGRPYSTGDIPASQCLTEWASPHDRRITGIGRYCVASYFSDYQ